MVVDAQRTWWVILHSTDPKLLGLMSIAGHPSLRTCLMTVRVIQAVASYLAM
jgi:hypothetical protein